MIGTAPYPPRTAIVNIRVTPEERRAIAERARAEQRTVSDWIRLVVLAPRGACAHVGHYTTIDGVFGLHCNVCGAFVSDKGVSHGR